MKTLFISDLHLNPKQPKITQMFLEFLKQDAVNAQALYILGDFFDHWVGDDAMGDFENRIGVALHELVHSGVKVYLMPGNRDFLYGHVFAQKSGVILIPDPIKIDLNGTPTLLVHGDSLCTADKGYQVYRALVRHPVTKFIFLHFPLALRKKIGIFLRQQSREGNQKRPDYLMDVEQKTVEDFMNRYHVLQMIHGHTHAHKVLSFKLDGELATRTVLGAWDETQFVLQK